MPQQNDLKKQDLDERRVLTPNLAQELTNIYGLELTMNGNDQGKKAEDTVPNQQFKNVSVKGKRQSQYKASSHEERFEKYQNRRRRHNLSSLNHFEGKGNSGTLAENNSPLKQR